MRQTILTKGPEVRRRILLVLVFLTPLFFLRNAYDVFNVPKFWLVMVGVALVGGIRSVELLQGAKPTGLTLVAVPALAVAGCLAIGVLLSPYRVWSLVGDHGRFTGLFPYLAIIGFAVLVADAFRAEPRRLCWALTGSGAVAGAYAVVQVVGLDPFEWSATHEAVATIGNTNFSGAFFAICLPLGVGLFLVETERRPLVAALTLLVAAGWVVARSETGWAAGVAGLAVLGGSRLSVRWPPARFVGVVAVVLIATAGVVLVTTTVKERLPYAIQYTVERRADMWEGAFRMAASSPIFGRGPSSFAIEYSHHRDIDDVLDVGLTVSDDPHSVPLSFLTGAGIFGLVGFLTVAAWILLNALKAGSTQVIAASFAGAACAYLIQSLFTIDVVALRFAGWTAMAATAAALAPADLVAPKPFSRKKKRAAEQRPEPLKALPAVVAVVLIVTAGTIWATRFLLADVSFQRGLSPDARGFSAQQNLRSAIEFRESNDTYRRAYGRLLGANATRQALQEGGDLALARQFLREAEQTLSFVEDFPHANSLLIYARVMRDWAQVDDSAEDDALQLYERAIELDPYNYLILDEAAAAASAFGREDAAERLAAWSTAIQQSAEG